MVTVERSAPTGVAAARSCSGTPYERALVLVREDGRPRGAFETRLPLDGLSAHDLERRMADADADGRIPPPADDPPVAIDPAATTPAVTVVVATCDRPELLRRCLESILTSDYPSFDVLVVDNTRDSIASQRVAGGYGPRVRWVREPRPGLANAHNRALAEVTAPIVAFTDDDVVVDEYWLSRLVAGFGAAPDVACVTGMIFPMELETPAQDLVERSIGFNKGYARRVYRLDAADRAGIGVPLHRRRVRLRREHGLPHRAAPCVRRVRPRARHRDTGTRWRRPRRVLRGGRRWPDARVRAGGDRVPRAPS